MRPALPILFALAIAACSPAEPPVSDLTAEEPPVEMPLRLADEDADMEEIADSVIGSINPLENDLRGLEVAVRLRDEFRITDTGVEFELKATGPDGQTKVDELLKLRETSGIESELLNAEAREGFYITTFALEDADKPAIAAADSVLQVMREEAPGQNDLTFQAIAHTCVEPASSPEQYSLTLFVRSHPDVDFVTLSNEWIMDRGDEGIAEMLFRRCAS
ncbi:MAG: hypothetical protein QNI84_05600 [Henriciella sp.]|nr:hypothetical protein [Henriciella sp.]